MAFINSRNPSSSGSGIGGTVVQSGTAGDYTVDLTYDCGTCSNGPCDPTFTYQWTTTAPPSLTLQVVNADTASPTIIPTLDLGGSGFGIAQYEHQVLVSLMSGSGACLSTTQAVIMTTVDVFA